MSVADGAVLALRVYMESNGYIYNYTGKLTKTLVLTEAPELEPLFRPSKGFFKLLRVSPPLSGNSSVIPVYEVTRNNKELRPVLLRGEYVVEVGANGDTVRLLYNRFKQIEGVRTRLKFENAVVSYTVEDASIHTPQDNKELEEKLKTIVVRTLSPALLPHPLVPTQHVRRFTTSPGVFFWVPYMIAQGTLSLDPHKAFQAAVELESCLAEHYSTKQKAVFVNYDNNREPTLTAKAKYIVLTREKRCEEIVKRTLQTARIYGIGASRANGFGTITIAPQKIKIETKR
ncbi:MAG: hypothetical protein QXU97_05425 [Fervidicoccaceae archaeon]